MERTGRRARWLVATASFALIGGVTVAALPVSAQATGVQGGTAASGNAHAPKVEPLIDHGGPVLANSVTYTLWWGDYSQWPAVVSGIPMFLEGLNGSAFLNTAAQYMPGGSIGSSYGGTWSDSTAPPAKMSVSTLSAEVARGLGQGTFPVKPETGDVFLVYTSNFPKGGGFCAWHSGAMIDGVAVAVAYLPNVAGVAGCSDPTPSTFSQDPTLAAQANDTSHEFMESITDPQINAWYDQSGREMGDKCETTYGGTTTLSNTTTWYLQEEWSNATGGCVVDTPIP